jgi:signal transduction histidine kinase
MAADRTARVSVTALRLGGAFLAILALFAAALVFVLGTLDRIGQAEAEVSELDHAKHAGHMAAAMVREQYIHQAHTLINFDLSHVGHYDEVVQQTRAATEHLESLARTPDEKTRAQEIARLARESDQVFRSAVLPAVERGDRSNVRGLGEQTEAVVDQVVKLNEELNASFERRSAGARERAATLRAQARTATLVFFALAFGLSTAIALLLTRAILRPVALLREGARRVGAGDLEARIDVRGRDEFAELGTSFNQMTADLARKQEALLRSQKLASIGQIAAGVGHEINNPLGVILGYVKLMRRENDAEGLRIIEEEASQCQRIVRDLLDLARPPRLDLEPVDLGALARDAVARLEESGQLAGKTVELPPADARVVANGDEGKLRQVAANILLNAAQATPAGGRVTIDVAQDDGEVSFAIRDTGPGIPADVLPRIFEPFVTTKRVGTGLGLAIAHAIVDAHGGRIVVDSSAGDGTRVTVNLPAHMEARS